MPDPIVLPVVETVVAPGVVDPAAVVVPPVPAVDPAAPAPARADWKDDRIRVLAGQKGELNSRIKELETELAKRAVPPAPGAIPPPAPGLDPADVESRVNARAEEIAAFKDFDRKCNDTAAAGKAKYPDFGAKVGALLTLVDRNDPQDAAKYNRFLEVAMETGAGPDLIHRLGGDLNEAQRVMGLSPLRMAVELTKIVAAPKPSQGDPNPMLDPDLDPHLPKPITPINSGPGGQLSTIAPDDKDRADMLTTAEWMRRRDQQLDDGKPGRFRSVSRS